MFKKILYTFVFLLTLINGVFAEDMKNLDQNNVVYMELKDGVVAMELFPYVAPNHVLRIKQLTREGFYDGLTFHRVIDGFMVQTGDPRGDGTGGSRLFNLNAEFNDKKHIRGTASMARSANPNSANSQFFIVTGDYFPHLDRQYTVWGRVIDGMEYVDNIKKGDGLRNGSVDDPDKIIKMMVGSDLFNKRSTDESMTVKEVLNQLKQIQTIRDENMKDNPSKTEIKSVLEIMMELD